MYFIHLVFICLTTPWSRYTWVILHFNLYIFTGRHVFVIVHRSVRDISTLPTPRLILRIQGRAVYSKCFRNAWVVTALAPTVSSITSLSWSFSSWNSTVGETQGNSRFSSLMVCRPVSCRPNTLLDFFSQSLGFPRSHIFPWIGAELRITPSKQREREAEGGSQTCSTSKRTMRNTEPGTLWASSSTEPLEGGGSWTKQWPCETRRT